jgi:NAD(P)-dependent dehydrogenase (short-subunit alcohol dehydrogenase family)
MDKRYVVVTGASKGIGRATALYLDQHGFNVFAGIRSHADGEALQREASPALVPVQIDVTDANQIARAALLIKQTVGTNGLAGLVNNAGVAIGAPIEFIPIDELRRQLEINVVGQVAVTQALLPCIRQAKGRIINISSIGGRVAGPNIGAYHASKFALEAITDAMRVELSRWGIEVISIEPGAIRTDMLDTGIAIAQKLFSKMPPEFLELYPEMETLAERMTHGAFANGIAPEKVAEVIADALTTRRPKTRYLVGRDARFVGTFITRLPDRMRDRLMLMQQG